MSNYPDTASGPWDPGRPLTPEEREAGERERLDKELMPSLAELGSAYEAIDDQVAEVIATTDSDRAPVLCERMERAAAILMGRTA